MMFWFQKESGANPFRAECGLSLTESFLNSISQNAKENLYRDEKALTACRLDAGLRDHSLSGYTVAPLRPALHMGQIGALID